MSFPDEHFEMVLFTARRKKIPHANHPREGASFDYLLYGYSFDRKTRCIQKNGCTAKKSFFYSFIRAKKTKYITISIIGIC